MAAIAAPFATREDPAAYIWECLCLRMPQERMPLLLHCLDFLAVLAEDLAGPPFVLVPFVPWLALL